MQEGYFCFHLLPYESGYVLEKREEGKCDPMMNTAAAASASAAAAAAATSAAAAAGISQTSTASSTGSLGPPPSIGSNGGMDELLPLVVQLTNPEQVRFFYFAKKKHAHTCWDFF